MRWIDRGMGFNFADEEDKIIKAIVNDKVPKNLDNMV